MLEFMVLLSRAQLSLLGVSCTNIKKLQPTSVSNLTMAFEVVGDAPGDVRAELQQLCRSAIKPYLAEFPDTGSITLQIRHKTLTGAVVEQVTGLFDNCQRVEADYSEGFVYIIMPGAPARKTEIEAMLCRLLSIYVDYACTGCIVPLAGPTHRQRKQLKKGEEREANVGGWVAAPPTPRLPTKLQMATPLKNWIPCPHVWIEVVNIDDSQDARRALNKAKHIRAKKYDFPEIIAIGLPGAASAFRSTKLKTSEHATEMKGIVSSIII